MIEAFALRGLPEVRDGDDLVDGLVCDEEHPDAHVPSLVTDTLLDTPPARERVARETLDFALGLA